MLRQTVHTTLTVLSLFAAGCGGDLEDFEDEELGGEPGLEEPAAEAEAPALEESESALFGSDACRNVDLRITNSFEDVARTARIRVEHVSFYSVSEGRYITEDLPNTEISYGQSSWFYNEDLQYAENDTISAWRVYFRYQESDNDWSDLVYQYIDTPNDVCHADDDYTMTVN